MIINIVGNYNNDGNDHDILGNSKIFVADDDDNNASDGNEDDIGDNTDRDTGNDENVDSNVDDDDDLQPGGSNKNKNIMNCN